MTKLCYIHLPRPQFTTLQKHVFPVYFALQTALAATTAITYPSGSILALAKNRGDAALLGATLGISILNWLIYGPRTSQLMVKRSHQGKILSSLASNVQNMLHSELKCVSSETRDGRNHDGTGGGISDEMKLLKRQFSREHAMTIHLNLLAIIGTFVYGLRLSSKIAC